jgi:hypothetical protein
LHGEAKRTPGRWREINRAEDVFDREHDRCPHHSATSMPRPMRPDVWAVRRDGFDGFGILRIRC